MKIKGDIKRDVFKTISYRIFGTVASSIIAYAFSGKVSTGIAVGVADLILKPAIYFLHERAWRRIK